MQSNQPATGLPAVEPRSDRGAVGAPLAIGTLRAIHHIALNVQDMDRSRRFYGEVLGLRELQGEAIPLTLKELVAAGKVANFVLPDGTVLDLFWEPDLEPPAMDPQQQFTRISHLAFEIDPIGFDAAVAVLQQNAVPIDHGPVSRPTGRGIYFYDPDGLLLEIRCDPPT
jgi:glyoxylase I family protein